MIRTGTLERSRANRRALRTPNGTGYFKSDFIISPVEGDVSPQAFLIEQEADSVIRPHFHQENQFQVIVDGSATLGSHEVGPINLHYASRHTGYGPISSGPRGVSYFSLRDRTTAQAFYLPESRDLMEDVPRRNVFAERFTACAPETLRLLARSQVTPVIDPQLDGLSAWVARVPPGKTLRIPTPDGGADRFYMVSSGSMVLDGAELPVLAMTFASAVEPDFSIVASAIGVEVLVMQYPVRS